MEEIILSENCFGLDVEVDGESLFMHEYDNRDPEFIRSLRLKLINRLLELENQLDMDDLTLICDIIINKDGYEMDYDNSKFAESCDQCGNYNHTHIYTKLEDEEKS